MKRLIAGLIIGILIGTAGVAGASDAVQAVFSKFNFVVNGEKQELDSDPLFYNGTTYLPVRAISNMLGYDVDYKQESRTIELKNIPTHQNGHKSKPHEGDDMINLNYNMTLMEIIDTVVKKYNFPEGSHNVSMEGEGNIKFKGHRFKLDYEEDNTGRRYYNVQPLLDAGILTLEDLN